MTNLGLWFTGSAGIIITSILNAFDAMILNGIRVLDLTHMLSGPYAGMMLADLGAETIKVEPPVTGEGTRRILERDPQHSLHGVGAYFITLNRNKKSVSLNLKSEKGLEIFYKLVKMADVVLSNFSVGVTERLKIDHAHLSQINPRIITCNITGIGENGRGKDRPSLDLVAQAMSGLMSITGQPGDPPTRVGIPIGDIGGRNDGSVLGKYGDGIVIVTRLSILTLLQIIRLRIYYFWLSIRAPSSAGLLNSSLTSQPAP